MKKISKIAILLVVAVMIISACGGKSSTGKDPGANPGTAGGDTAGTDSKDTIVIGLSANPVTLNPYNTTDSPAYRVIYSIHETLVKRDADMNIIPGLAESWEIVDDTTYVFHIRKGVKFHNGEELTANDVKFSFDQQNGNPHAESVTGTVDFENCKVIDEYTFEMKMKSPFGAILQNLAHPVASIVNEKAYTEAGDTYGENPVGTGPYKFVEWKADDYVSLTRFDEYWDETAKIKDVLIRIIPESSTRSIEVESGGIDIAVQVAPSEVTRLESNDKVVVDFQETFATNFIGLTNTHKPFDEVKVRQAVNYAINKEAILSVVYQGIGKVGSAPVSPTVWGYNPNLDPYAYNPDKARELLKEAGLENGFSTTITTDEDQVRRDVAEMIQAQLGEIGINVEIIPLERGAYIEKVIAGQLDMFVLGWKTFGDPDYALYASFHTTMQGAGGNMSFYSNPKVDALLEEGRSSVDDESRLKAYAEVQEIVWEESPCIFIQHDTEVTAYSAQLQGFNISPEGYLDLNKMYF